MDKREGRGWWGAKGKKGTIESNDRKASGRYLDRKDILERCSWLFANRARGRSEDGKHERKDQAGSCDPDPFDLPRERAREEEEAKKRRSEEAKKRRKEETTEWPRVALSSDSLDPAAARICSSSLTHSLGPLHREPRAALTWQRRDSRL